MRLILLQGKSRKEVSSDSEEEKRRGRRRDEKKKGKAGYKSRHRYEKKKGYEGKKNMRKKKGKTKFFTKIISAQKASLTRMQWRRTTRWGSTRARGWRSQPPQPKAGMTSTWVIFEILSYHVQGVFFKLNLCTEKSGSSLEVRLMSTRWSMWT